MFFFSINILKTEIKDGEISHFKKILYKRVGC